MENTSQKFTRNALFSLLFIIFVAIGAYYFFNASNTNSDVPPETITLEISFHKNDPFDCDVVQSIARTVPYTLAVADASLRELFKGPTEAEKALGVSSTFNPSSALASAYTEKEIKPPAEYYLGVSIKNKTAIVDFNREALAYLNSPACMQASVKSPIINTLLQFPTIERVDFSINGEVYTEWDA